MRNRGLDRRWILATKVAKERGALLVRTKHQWRGSCHDVRVPPSGFEKSVTKAPSEETRALEGSKSAPNPDSAAVNGDMRMIKPPRAAWYRLNGRAAGRGNAQRVWCRGRWQRRTKRRQRETIALARPPFLSWMHFQGPPSANGAVPWSLTAG